MRTRMSLRYRRIVAPVVMVLLLALVPGDGSPGLRGVAAAGVRPPTLNMLTDNVVGKPQAGKGAPQPACDGKKLAPAKSTRVLPNTSTLIRYDDATVNFKAGAVKSASTIEATSLCDTSIAPMDTGMTNVTSAPRRAYRLLPHQTFAADLTMTLPYDPALIPEGMTDLDVYTYYYDETAQSWVALERVSLDTVAHTVTSLTDHFTDFVNATLVAPDNPQTLSYDPTSIKDIKAADPGTGISLIAPPTANNSGDATLAYPIDLPAGRGGNAPTLGLRYDSQGPDGWLGLGWDLSIPAVTIDTRWGVPRYDTAQETETYTLTGEQLTPVANRGTPQPRTAEKVFHTRREADFATIVRHGSSPQTYWWEVTGKNGTRSFYGGSPETGQAADSILTDGSGNVFRWALRETRDLHGNSTRYTYATVSDPGVVGGTVPGKDLYPRTVNYTGSGGQPGAYTVTFIRDSELPGYTRRPDVVISARGRFVQVTAELLGRIDITFNGALVRRYDLNYTTGAFNKSLLKSVTQHGANGGTFNTHTFDYYDDIRNGGNYTGFAAPTNWQVGDDGVTAGLFNQGQATALSGALSTGVGGHLYVGYNPLVPRKQGSAGAKVGFTQSTNDGVLALVDLNGDNLPDKVFKDGDAIRFRLNTSGPSGNTTFDSTVRQAPTLPGISTETSQTTSFGAEAYLVANVFINHSTTFTDASTYFVDANGDGLMDLVRDGQVLFNHLDANGIPTFTANSADTPAPIGSGSVDASGIIDDFEADFQQRIDNYPLVDTLRRWVAPFDGRVQVTGDVALVHDTSSARTFYTTADGVRTTIQHNGSELWSTSIGANDYTAKTPTGVDSIPVSRGDRLYFRIQSNMDGAYDQVSWNPQITYLDVNPTTDVNNLGAYQYQAAGDFVLAGRSGVGTQMPYGGTIKLSGTLTKRGKTTDDVTVQVLRNGATAFTSTLPAATAGSVAVDQDLTVAKGDTVQFKVAVDSPIDVHQLDWVPSLAYTASSDFSPVLDPQGNPLMKVNPPYDVDIYPVDDLTAPQQAWSAPSTGTVTATAHVTASADGEVTFTAKRQVPNAAGDLLAKQSIKVSAGTQVDVPVSLDVSARDQVYFDFSVRDPNLSISSATVDVDGDSAPSAVHKAAAAGLLPAPYRGWQYAGYNGNRDRALQPINEDDLALTFTADSTYDPRTAKAYLFTPDPAGHQWKGPDDLTWVRADTASSSRLGLDNLAVPRPSDFAGRRAVDRLTSEDQTAVGGGVSFVSGSASKGSTKSQVDYMDLNGDRYPDIVSASGQVQYSTLNGGLSAASQPVPGLGPLRGSDADAFNVGVGGSPAAFFANGKSEVDPATKAAPRGNTTGTQMQPLGLSGSIGRGDSDPNTELLDINGDGLPDRIFSDGGTLRVSLNLGYAFAQPELWGSGALNAGASENGSLGATLGFNTGDYEFAGGVSLTKNKSQTSQTLDDINGDGLLDEVLPGGDGMRVAFNTGSGFAPPVPWGGALNGVCHDNTSVGLAGIDWDHARLCSGTTGLGAGAYFTFGIGPLCFAACWIVVNPGADTNQSMSREEAALRDVDGDGYADHVASTSDGNLVVARNLTGRTNLLKSVSRPMGATINLEYQRDGNTVDAPQSQWVMSKVSVFDGHQGDGDDNQVTAYQYSGGVYDRNEREFRGYAKVVEQTLDASGGVYRSAVRGFRTDSYYTKGLPTKVQSLDGSGHMFTETEYTYLLRDVSTGAEPADPNSTTATIFAQQVRVDYRFFEGDPAVGKSTFTTAHYDAVGNVDRETDVGDTGPGDDVVTTIAYSPCIKDAPVSLTVTGNGTVVRHRESTMDCNTGDMTQIREFLADGTASITDMAYFPNGNLQTVTGPPNASGQRFTLSYQYDPDVSTFITKTTDSFGLSSQATYDPRFGTILTNVDDNNNATTYTVDEFGRTSSITGPYQQGTGNATIRFEYHPEAAVPWAITRHLDTARNTTDTIDTVTFTDGLGRALQTKKDITLFTGASSAPVDVMSVSGKQTYDFAGRVVQSFYPTTEPLGTAGVFNTTPDSVQPTRTAYDIRDRATSITLPNNAVTTTSYGFGPDRSGATEFQNTVTDASGNVKRTYANVRHDVTSLEELHTPDGGAQQSIWTSYTYDALDQITGVLDDHNNASGAEYDNLGRRTAVTTADGGRTETRYDLAGNEAAKITPNLRATSQQVSYTYDFNRLTAISYPQFPQNNVTYTYGAPGASDNRAGRITRVTDGSGTDDRFYGKLGEVVKDTKTVNTDTGGTAGSYTTLSTFDTFGRLLTLTYPDGEVLTYQYDSGGEVRSATGTNNGNTYNYFTRLEYDKFGERAFLATGDGTQTNYSYDPTTRLLANIQAGPAGGQAFQNLLYDYDKVGNVIRLRNDVPVPTPNLFGGPSTQNFSYDDLYRLTSATGTYEYEPDKFNNYTFTQTYDSIHNVLTKQQTNDLVEPGGTSVNQQKTSFSQSYDYAGPKPHAASHIGAEAFTYDANGNQTGFTDDNSGQRRTIVWDEENRIESLSDNGHTETYKYDDSGARVEKRGPQGETVYVNEYYTVRNGALGTKHVYAGDTRIASKIAKKNSLEKDQFYFHPDSLGSNTYVTDTNGKIFRHTEFFPSGESWIDEASNTQRTPYLFAGKEFDEETGLYYFGARYYDPRTGVWQSTDPDAGSYLAGSPGGGVFKSENLAAYTYGENSPEVNVDPTGAADWSWSAFGQGAKGGVIWGAATGAGIALGMGLLAVTAPAWVPVATVGLGVVGAAGAAYTGYKLVTAGSGEERARIEGEFLGGVVGGGLANAGTRAGLSAAGRALGGLRGSVASEAVPEAPGGAGGGEPPGGPRAAAGGASEIPGSANEVFATMADMRSRMAPMLREDQAFARVDVEGVPPSYGTPGGLVNHPPIPGVANNTSLNHAEGQAFLALFQRYGLSLAGRRATLYVDRPVCNFCQQSMAGYARMLGLDRLDVVTKEGPWGAYTRESGVFKLNEYGNTKQ